MFDNFVENANKFLSRLFGSRNQRLLRTFQPLVDQIRGLEPEFQRLTEAELRAKTVRGGRTRVGATAIDGEDRVREVARMLGGEAVTPTAIGHARELLGGRAPRR